MELLIKVLSYLLTAGVFFLMGMEVVLIAIGEEDFKLLTWVLYGVLAIIGFI